MSLKSFNPRSSDLVCWEWTLTKVRKSHIGKGRFLLHGSAIPVAFHPLLPSPLPSLPRPSFFSPLGFCHRSFGLISVSVSVSPFGLSPSVFLFGLSPSVFPFVLPLRSSPSFSPSVSPFGLLCICRRSSCRGNAPGLISLPAVPIYALGMLRYAVAVAFVWSPVWLLCFSL